MLNPLQDTEFLKKLDSTHNRQNYVRITSLDLQDRPREQIEGMVTGGSINIDGASSVRRSCSLTMAALPDSQITDYYWVFDTKFKLEIGLQNDIDDRYPSIIWFKQGIYIITAFSANKSTNNISISISGQDKMCRLNGEVSGNFLHQVDLGQYEEVDDYGNIRLHKLTIAEIIQNMMVEYGEERIENIIINDLDQYGYEIWDYRGDTPIYLLCSTTGSQEIANLTLDGEVEVTYRVLENEQETFAQTRLKRDDHIKYYSFYTLDPTINVNATQICFDTNPNADSKWYYVAKISYGETAGYHRIPLVYNTDLIANVNETVTSVLDKLQQMLGNFEYFYDLDGRFVFQKKKTYQQELFSPINGQVAEPNLDTSIYSYIFEDESKFTSISNPPNLKNLKNDFSVWGSRDSASGASLPIHIRMAIDKKPTRYCTTQDTRRIREKDLYKFYEADIDLKKDGLENRIIYEKIKRDDNYAYYYECSNITREMVEADQKDKQNATQYKYKYLIFSDDSKAESYTGNWGMLQRMPDGGYRNYYPKGWPVWYREKTTDTEQESQYHELKTSSGVVTWETWNDEVGAGLFNNFDLENYNYYFSDKTKLYYTSDYTPQPGDSGKPSKLVDWREVIYQMAYDYRQGNKDFAFYRQVEAQNPECINGRTGYENYYGDLEGFWRSLYSPYLTTYSDARNYGEYYPQTANMAYWNKKIHTDPYSFNFWFDFLDTEGELSKFAVHKIDARTKGVNETTIKSIYYKEVPEILFFIGGEETIAFDDKMAYIPLQIAGNMAGLFYRSSQGVSAISRVNDLIYQHAGCAETISLTCIPIYYLQPNTKIKVKGEDYTLDQISYSLTYNGTMNISGTKIIKQFI